MIACVITHNMIIKGERKILKNLHVDHYECQAPLAAVDYQVPAHD
jgi:hypothetical protein